MLIFTRYGEIRLSRHAIQRWRERTGRNYPELVEALATANRPTKNRLRRIMKERAGWQPRRILECDHAFFIIKSRIVVTVYDKRKEEKMLNPLERPYTSVHAYSTLQREIEMAQTLIEHDGTAFPDHSFEDGYIAALNFVMNREGSNVREEYESLMDEQQVARSA